MSDETKAAPAVSAAAASDSEPATRSDNTKPEVKQDTSTITNGSDAPGGANNATDSTDSEAVPPTTAADSKAETTGEEEASKADQSVGEPGMEPSTPTAPSGEAATDASTSKPKSQSRRKSVGVPEHRGKKLNKKASKAKITHTDAQPGEHYFIKLRGFPLWPGIICDEAMLPSTLLKSRPVTAMRPDGTYRADYESGGKNVNDRSFPVMYLATNEFGWIPNFDLQDLDTANVLEGIEPKMRKDLQEAYRLASENHDLDYYKQLLAEFQEQVQKNAEEKAASKAAKQAQKTNKKKTKASTDDAAEDEDVEMADAGADEDAEGASKPKSSKKRKTDDLAETPQRTDSVKKLKLKVTPKVNGDATPKSTSKKDGASKSAKAKAKKAATNGTDANELSKDSNLSAEEKRIKKQKEVLFYRHKLQRGLLTREQAPKEEEMEEMSGFITILEDLGDLEVSVIRHTKVNKVLKAILKLEQIPREAEFKFKERSQVLLTRYNKALEESGEPATTNGAAPNTADEPVATIEGKDTKAQTKVDVASDDKEKSTSDGAKAAETESAEPATIDDAEKSVPNDQETKDTADDTKTAEDSS